MYINRNTKIMLASCVFLFFIAGVFRLIDMSDNHLPIRLSAISYLAHGVLCMLCLIYLKRDIPNTMSRRFLMSAVAFLFAWQLFGMFKDVIYTDEYALNRWIWYSYYIPMLFIPVFLLLASQHSGLHNSQRINPA